jgi:cysteine desulfurase
MAKRRMSEARERIASSLGGADSEQLVLTSSGSEANQLAIRSALEAKLASGAHYICTAVEHDSVLQMKAWIEARGGSVSFLPVDRSGAPVVSELASLIRPETALISAVWVNNETGVIADVAALAAIAKERGIPLHLDAAQAWGKLPIDVSRLGADYLTFSAHKIGALAGTGVLWAARGRKLEAMVLGKQEKGRRGGSENLLGAVACGRAASELDPLAFAARVAPLRDRLEGAISERIPGTRVNGGSAPRVANTLNLSFDGVEGDGMVMALDLAGFSVSSGSACSSGAIEPSHVLLAMGRSKSEAMAAIRVSLHEGTTWEELEGFVPALAAVVERMRKAIRRSELGSRQAIL